jgi:hypothetical protein
VFGQRTLGRHNIIVAAGNKDSGNADVGVVDGIN